MNRSGFVDNCDTDWDWIRWNGAVKSAIRGKRGQVCLREMLAALDALPEPRLIANKLEDEGEYCALGALARKRGIDVQDIDPKDHDLLSDMFDIAPALVREIEFENDDGWYDETPERRWHRVRKWVVQNLHPAPPEEQT